MSAEVLREAASQMRERAEVAQCEPESAPDHRLGWYATDDHLERALVSGSHATRTQAERDAEYITSWHPAVALAVADWLEEVAAWRDEGLGLMPDGNLADAWLSVERQAKVVARAYLGGRS